MLDKMWLLVIITILTIANTVMLGILLGGLENFSKDVWKYKDSIEDVLYDIKNKLDK
jgi:hypothetical protein